MDMYRNLQFTLARKKVNQKLVLERVVKDFCKTIQEKSFKIYADNYFSSLNLAKNLLDNGIGYCETIRCNRKNLPQMKKDTSMNQGDMDY